jgi:sulfur carrier protein ThiS
VKIRIRTSGRLGQYLPAGSSGDRGELDVDAGATPLVVMERLGIPLEDSYLIAVNGAVIPPSQRAVASLAENDELSIMPPLRGG